MWKDLVTIQEKIEALKDNQELNSKKLGIDKNYQILEFKATKRKYR